MKNFWAILVVWFMGCACASAQPADTVKWQAAHVHYAFPGKVPYDAWVIKPAEGAVITVDTFEATIDRIYRTDRNPVIQYICFGDAHRRGPLQDEVIQQLTDTVVVKKYPTRHDSDGRMYLDGTANALTQTMRQLVYSAILNTSTVKEMNRILGKHGFQIKSVSTEKLFITSEKGCFRWDALGCLIVERIESSATPQSRTPTGSGSRQAPLSKSGPATSGTK